MANIALIVDNILSDSGVPITYSTSGTNGTSGINGSSGTSASSGSSGTSATSGTSGSSGTSATSGSSGTSATSGTSGSSGTSGTKGTSGTSGANGSSGTSGTKGTSGTAGTSGSSGSSGAGTISGTTNTVAKFTAATTIGNSNITDDGTTVTIASNTYVNGSFKFYIRSNQSSYGQIQIGATTAGGEASLAFVGGVSSGLGTGALSSGDGTGAVWAIGSNVYGIGTTVFGIGNASANGAVFRITSAGAATITGSVTAGTDVTLNNGVLYISAGSGTSYSSRLSTVYNFPFVDTYLDSYGGPSWEGRLNFRTNSGGGAMSTKMTILNSGNVLIGTTTENSYGANVTSIQMNGVSGSLYETRFNGTSGLRMGSSSDHSYFFDPRNVYTYFATNGTERMRITSGGNVGINTSAPDVTFHVNGKSYVGTMTNYTPAVHIRGAFYGGPRLQVYGLDADANGWMGLGTDMSSSPYELSIYYSTNAASSICFGKYDGTATQYGGFTPTARLSNAGTWTVAGDVVAYGSPSDVSLKQNIKPIEDALEKILELEGVSFDWIEETEVNSLTGIKEDLGFIAQQVQRVIPKLVRENSNGKLSLRDKGILPYLVEGMKEQQKQIEELKTIISGLTK